MLICNGRMMMYFFCCSILLMWNFSSAIEDSLERYSRTRFSDSKMIISMLMNSWEEEYFILFHFHKEKKNIHRDDEKFSFVWNTKSASIFMIIRSRHRCLLNEMMNSRIDREWIKIKEKRKLLFFSHETLIAIAVAILQIQQLTNITIT